MNRRICREQSVVIGRIRTSVLALIGWILPFYARQPVGDPTVDIQMQPWVSLYQVWRSNHSDIAILT